VLTVQGLRKAFPATRRGGLATVAVDGIDLAVPAGAFASVLGPSGSGKTTLLRCIAGFERPDAGVITLRGRELVSPTVFVRAYERGVGIVPQEGALFPHLTVSQNVGFGLTGRSRRTRRDRVESLLDLVNLAGLGGRRPDQLSGGQQQRVALARALAPEPELILLDEPFSALDAQLRAELREEVRDLLQGIGSTTLLVTHDQAEAMSLADHLVVMRDGRVIAAGDPREVYDRPTDAELGRFLGEALVVPGHVTRDPDGLRVVCALGRLEVGHWHGAEGACDVLIRPEQIDVHAADDAARRPAVLGTVESQSYFGHDALMRLGVPGVQQWISVRVPGGEAYKVGDQAALQVTQPVSTYPKGI
jgi:iron(III) transport system ATP-binding protein